MFKHRTLVNTIFYWCAMIYDHRNYISFLLPTHFFFNQRLRGAFIYFSLEKISWQSKFEDSCLKIGKRFLVCHLKKQRWIKNKYFTEILARWRNFRSEYWKIKKDSSALNCDFPEFEKLQYRKDVFEKLLHIKCLEQKTGSRELKAFSAFHTNLGHALKWRLFQHIAIHHEVFLLLPSDPFTWKFSLLEPELKTTKKSYNFSELSTYPFVIIMLVISAHIH